MGLLGTIAEGNFRSVGRVVGHRRVSLIALSDVQEVRLVILEPRVRRGGASDTAVESGRGVEGVRGVRFIRVRAEALSVARLPCWVAREKSLRREATVLRHLLDRGHET